MKFPKPKTIREPAFLAWLRTRECCWCHARPPSEAAHQGGGRGTATKAPDDRAVALCSTCHRLSHSSMTPSNAAELAKRGGVWVVTAASFRVMMEVESIRLRAEYIADGTR